MFPPCEIQILTALLCRSSKYIEKIYLKYQASEAEEKPVEEDEARRKRKDTIGDEDDFIAEKRVKVSSSDLAKSPEMQFGYSLSPGFHA